MDIVPKKQGPSEESVTKNRSLSCIVDIYKNKDLLEFFRTSIYSEGDVQSIKMLLDSLEKFESMYHNVNSEGNLGKDDLVALLEFSLKNKHIRRQIVDYYSNKKCLE